MFPTASAIVEMSGEGSSYSMKEQPGKDEKRECKSSDADNLENVSILLVTVGLISELKLDTSASSFLVRMPMRHIQVESQSYGHHCGKMHGRQGQ